MSDFKLYNCIDEKGVREFPTQEEINSIKGKNITPILILDSCVCFDIIKFVESKSKLQSKEQNLVENFLVFQKLVDIDILGSFGILELSLGGKQFKYDSQKFLDFGNKFLTGLELNIDQILSNKPIIPRSETAEFEEHHSTIYPLLQASYASLLKLRLLAMEGTSKKNSFQLLEKYISWLKNELDCIMGLELDLAANIFGGNDSFRPMLALKKDVNIPRVLWGTAWDFCHHRLVCQFSNIYEINGIKHKTYFITKDNILSLLMKETSLEVVLKSGTESLRTFLSSSSNIKHFIGKEEKIVKLYKDLMIERIPNGRNKNSNRDVNQLIEELEIQSGIN
jgi:hypothetical protein